MARERWDSQGTTRDGKNSTHTQIFRLPSTHSTSGSAMTEFLTLIPSSVIVDGVTLDHVVKNVTPLGAGYWVGEASYKHKASDEAEDQNDRLAETDDLEISLEMTSESATITVAKELINTYPTNNQNAADIPTVGLVIGFDGEEVQGCDILVPSGSFTITKVFDATSITNAWIKARANKRCKTNSDTFYGYDPGELLFTGFTMSYRNSGDAPVAFSFQQRENQTGITIGTSSSIAKKGHEYLFTKMTPTTDDADKAQVSKPEYVTIHRVYDTTTFADILNP